MSADVHAQPGFTMPANHPLRRLSGVGLLIAAAGLGLVVLGAIFTGISAKSWADKAAAAHAEASAAADGHGGHGHGGGGVSMGAAIAKRFHHGYLAAFMFWLSIALGALFFTLIQYATRAGWSIVVRRMAEHMAGTLVWAPLLFIPVLIGSGTLYHHWMHYDPADPVLTSKAGYLNFGFWFIRAYIYLGLWALIAWWFTRQSAAQDHEKDAAAIEAGTRRMQARSYPALLAFALTSTFASFDWIMSLYPHWYSTIFGVYFFAGSAIGVMAALIALTRLVRAYGLLNDAITVEHDHDMGKLLFAFTSFWAYIAFSQLILIWYANIPEETVFYRDRMEGSWSTASVFLLVGHFILPFLFLMARTVKRTPLLLLAGALWMLAMHYFDLFWLVMPNRDPAGFNLTAIDLGCLLGLGGLFIAAVGKGLNTKALVPVNDPRLEESLAFENA